MKKKALITIIIVVVLLTLAGVIYSIISGDKEAHYQFGEVTRGTLESTISSSGTLTPVTTLEVGTQVSGTIAHIYVDFNDKVEKGQLLAVLDTVTLKASVLDAQASMERAEAQLEEAQAEYDRNLPLFEKELLSEAEFLPYRFNLKTQKANFKSAQASMQRAERNLKYAMIYSPISGTVIQRTVEEGQTVAASFSTPTLFKIAEDLSQMEILAAVDESDIGKIAEGQTVRFDVQAYPDRKFTGTVKQVRLQPETVSNVVTYTVVIHAANEENILLPGMTATIDFIIEQRENALLVPNKALRFQPDEKVAAEFFKTMRRERPSVDSTRARQGSMPGGQNFPGTGQGRSDESGFQRPKDVGQVWYQDQNGRLAMDFVRTGTTDGTNTEVLMGRSLQEGMQVITGTESNASKKSTSQNTGPRFGPGGPRPF